MQMGSRAMLGLPTLYSNMSRKRFLICKSSKSSIRFSDTEGVLENRRCTMLSTKFLLMWIGDSSADADRVEGSCTLAAYLSGDSS